MVTDRWRKRTGRHHRQVDNHGTQRSTRASRFLPTGYGSSQSPRPTNTLRRIRHYRDSRNRLSDDNGRLNFLTGSNLPSLEVRRHRGKRISGFRRRRGHRLYVKSSGVAGFEHCVRGAQSRSTVPDRGIGNDEIAAPTSETRPGESTPRCYPRKAGVHSSGIVNSNLCTGFHTPRQR